MDVVKAVQNYVVKMVNSVAGMKILLLDAETTPIVSVVATQSLLLTNETYLVDKINNRNREKMRHMNCIVFVRPSAEALQAIHDELRDPAYGEYYLCTYHTTQQQRGWGSLLRLHWVQNLLARYPEFQCNALKKSDIERLANVDEHEVVKEVQEYFADYSAINPDFFSLNMTLPQNPLYGETLQTWDGRTFQKVVDGLTSVLLSLKKKPLIRYAKSSPMAKRLAQEINYTIQHESQLFDFRRTDTPPILLIFDRRIDPVTPLLTQWTYQAMVHDLLGTNNGRVDLSQVPDIRDDLKEIVLSADQDPFYKKNMFNNLGDLGASIKSYVDEYQVKTKSNMKIDSISDMKRFVEEYPEFRKLTGNVSKHVALVSELSRLVTKNKLLEVGELEQSLACMDTHSQHLKAVQGMLARTDVNNENKLRLVLLYALRYERTPNNSTSTLIAQLAQAGVTEKMVSLVGTLLQYAGSDQRQDDLFANETILSRGRSVFQGLKGVENIYTQHTPQIAEVIDMMVRGRLKETSYPFMEGVTKDKPQDIIVFCIGGATYEEARYVAQFNAENPGVRVVLGGTTVHNMSSFLSEIQDAVSRMPHQGGGLGNVARSARTPSLH